jgi:antitoxin (DNA-binding transcriptional repressor) of toxin-antitoxin stability system
LTKTVNIRKTPKDWKELLSQVLTGTKIIFTENGTPVARLLPVGQRIAGLHANPAWISKEFGKPLLDSFWAEEK